LNIKRIKKVEDIEDVYCREIFYLTYPDLYPSSLEKRCYRLNDPFTTLPFIFQQNFGQKFFKNILKKAYKKRRIYMGGKERKCLLVT